MQIKEVCEITGLTARTIRFYIEEGLISPNQKRKYNGRRNISFDKSDCKDLKEITLLRQASFSLSEIKELRKDKSKTFEYAVRCKRYYENEIKKGTKRVAALGHIDESITYDEFMRRLGATGIKTDEGKVNIKSYLPKLAYYICLATCFVAFSYFNLLFIGLSSPTGQFTVYTTIASVILFLSVLACILSFIKPKFGFIYILFELMVAAFIAYYGEIAIEGVGILLGFMLTAVIVNAAFYIFYIFKMNLLMNKK